MSQTVSLEPGSDVWKKWRKLATETQPGRHSALYFLVAKVLQKENLVPLTPRVHLPMCLFAESSTGIPEIDEARIKLVLVPRGCGKTTAITKAKPILNIVRNRNYSTLIANEKQGLADTFLGDIKAEFETNAILQTLFPEVIPDNFRDTIWAADRIITKRDKLNPTNPSVLATGVGATITGVHVNEAICDDLLSQNAAENAFRGSFTEIESTNRWITRLQPLLNSPKRDKILFIGTRWWEGDSYEFIEEFWSHGEPKREFIWRLKIPAYRHEFEDKQYEYAPETRHFHVYRRGEIAVFRMPARDDAGRPIFPERYDEEELQLLEQEDPVFFAGQYLLEPTAGAASEFDPADLKYYEIDGAHLRHKNQLGETVYLPLRELTTVISVDPAFSKKHTAARTAIPVVGTNGSELFLLEDFADRGMSEDDIAHQVLDFYMRYHPQKVIVETIVAQVAVANAIRRIFRDNSMPEPIIDEIPHHGNQRKNLRIYGLAHYFKRGLFNIHRRHSRFIQEYRSFPRSALRDLLDALAFQVNEWERMFRIANSHQPGQGKQIAEQSAIARIRKAWGRRRR